MGRQAANRSRNAAYWRIAGAVSHFCGSLRSIWNGWQQDAPMFGNAVDRRGSRVRLGTYIHDSRGTGYMKAAYSKLRLLGKWLICKLHLAGMVNLVEYCDDCGVRQPLVWYSADQVWREVTGEVGGVLCPRCFNDRAGRKGLLLYWSPVIEHRREPDGS